MTGIKVGRRSDIHPDYPLPRVKSGASAEASLRGRRDPLCGYPSDSARRVTAACLLLFANFRVERRRP
jgi:hypothetical protein